MRLSFLLLAGVVGIATGYAIYGCQSLLQTTPVKKASRVYDRAQFKADALPYEYARTLLSGTEIPTTLKREVDGDNVVFKFVRKSEVLEEEHYQSNASGFRFESLTGETFDPPVPLINYPFEVGQKGDWAGTAGLGPTAKPATATMTSSEEKLNLTTGVSDCVKISVQLEVATGGNVKSKRLLVFWFEPGTGLMKRDFEYSSSREPRVKTPEDQ